MVLGFPYLYNTVFIYTYLYNTVFIYTVLVVLGFVMITALQLQIVLKPYFRTTNTFFLQVRDDNGASTADSLHCSPGGVGGIYMYIYVYICIYIYIYI